MVPTSSILQLGPTNTVTTPQAYYLACKSLNPQTSPLWGGLSFSAMGRAWYCGVPHHTRYSHVMPPNTWSCYYQGGFGGGAITASSRHPGVANVLMADGSVHAIKSSVAINVWWGLGSRSGSEVISADSY